MAKLVQLSGLPGTGKSYGVKYLDPKTTFVIDCDKKGMSWAGWSKVYNKENKNYVATSDISTVIKVLKHISESRPEIQVVTIDTISAIMSDMVMLERRKPTFDQWRQFAQEIYELYDIIRSDLREDLIVVTMAHIEPYEINGTTRWRTRFEGKALTRSNMSGKLNYNLYTEVEHNATEPYNNYSLVTQSDGTTEARSTAGVLPFRMQNNLDEVVKLIKEKD